MKPGIKIAIDELAKLMQDAEQQRDHFAREADMYAHIIAKLAGQAAVVETPAEPEPAKTRAPRTTLPSITREFVIELLPSTRDSILERARQLLHVSDELRSKFDAKLMRHLRDMKHEGFVIQLGDQYQIMQPKLMAALQVTEPVSPPSPVAWPQTPADTLAA